MKDEIRAFLHVVLGESEGYLCINTRDSKTGNWKQHMYNWPREQDKAIDRCVNNAMAGDVYFAPHLFGTKKVGKENVIECSNLWADLDELDPDELKIEPTILIQTSPDRTQGYWLLDKPADPQEAEVVTKAIAYAHHENGADKGGWDLTQRLRIPLTYNHKYDPIKKVKILEFNKERYSLDEIAKAYATQKRKISFANMKAPEPQDADLLMDRYKATFNPRVIDLYTNTPNGDWSTSLWQLELFLFEAGLSDTEVYSIARESACNKYERDGRSDSELWAEVQRAKAKVEADNDIAPVASSDDIEAQAVTPLLTDEERKEAADTQDFVQEYIEWAKRQSDAAWQYHQGGGFIVLSTLLSGAVTLPTSFGTLLPNLWCMILADTTLTRKSTAMRLATELINDVDPDAILATDGSIEGLLTSLSIRPGRPSMFLRDEITGLIESVAKKDYYAGMLEAFTKLYDGERQKRILKKETIDVKSPNFIFFGGGIKSKMMEILTQEHVMSGFLPRFIFITAEADPTKLKPIGPPQDEDKENRNKLQMQLIRMYKWFRQSKGEDGRTKAFTASLTEEAWVAYNRYEHLMVTDALNSLNSNLMTPVMARLAITGLKCSVLLAASGSIGKDEVLVTETHLRRAFYFVEQWREHTLEVVSSVGSSREERQIERVLAHIKANPGIARSDLMQMFKLRPREADVIFGTLLERELIKQSKQKGRKIVYEAW